MPGLACRTIGTFGLVFVAGAPLDRKPTIRLGEIYALGGVMNDSAQYHQPVLEASCAADLTSADRWDANLSGANLTDAIGLSQAQLDAACGTGARRLPAGVTQDRPCRPGATSCRLTGKRGHPPAEPAIDRSPALPGSPA